MKWTSSDYTISMVRLYSHLIPNDFDPVAYMDLHPDLIINGVDNEQKAKEHYLLHGRQENRMYKKPIIQSISIDSHRPEFWNNGKNLLYFSPMAPDYDCSSGGNRLLQILKILKLDLDYNVWFLCNGSHSDRYIQAIKDLDIPIFLPDIKQQKYLDVCLKDAKDNNIIFDNAIFSWYDIGNQYIDIVKSIYPNIKIIVDTVDIHWIREQRGKDCGEFPMTQEAIDIRKTIEIDVYNKADVVFAITETDKKHIQKEIGYNKNIKILSNIHDNKNIKLGSNICFIGNYAHDPNIDAAKRCLDIYKLFQQTLCFKKLKKKPKLNFVGPNLPSEIVAEVAKSKNVKYLGHIKDLDEIYRDSCILLSPLSWGAGIKGKICDAGMCGIPILTSNIGNEGIDFIDGTNALIADTNEEFVEKLSSFFSMSYQNKQKLGTLGQHHLMSIVSKKAATTVLKHSLQDKHIVLSIVTYNQPERLQQCLNSILSLTKYSNYTIYISDNSENLDTPVILSQNYADYLLSKKIIYHKNADNDYFIKPNNTLFMNKKYRNSDFVLINDDVKIIDGDWLSYLYSSAYSADYIAAAGGKTIYTDGSLAEAGAELYNDGKGKNIGRYDNPQKDEYNVSKYVGYCSGCLLYMRHDAIDQIGIFSDRLEKLYYEDSDWQYRAHFYGLKTIYDHRCCAIHDEGSTSGTDMNTGAKKYQKINQKIFLDNMTSLGIENIEIFNR